MKISRAALEEVEKALIAYEEEAGRNLGTPKSRWTYQVYAGYFVRWLKDEFTPGGTRPGKR